MNTVTPAIRNFAQQLIAIESAREDLPGNPVACAARVCDRLRVSLARLAGVAGFRSLISRAMALAKAEVPTLAAAKVHIDGTLEGLDGLPHEAGPAIVAQLLELLVTFIGEPLTLRLVRDAWPEATGADAENEEQP
jgi:hypothetical protein